MAGAKAADIVGLYLGPPEKALVICVDEKPSIQALERKTGYVETDSGRHHFPSPAQVPALMGDFAQWLGAAAATPETAFVAHRRLVEIHPFNDGNGRTARLLMNLVLLRGGYPPVAQQMLVHEAPP